MLRRLRQYLDRGLLEEDTFLAQIGHFVIVRKISSDSLDVNARLVTTAMGN